MEIRVIDAQAGNDWESVTAMVTALMDDEHAADLAAEACAPVASLSNPLRTAARHALTNPVLASAAYSCAEAALMALPRLGVDATTLNRAEDFVDRYTARGRCPADERLEVWRRTGSYFVPSEHEEHCKNVR
jgi:glutamate--cysteine ligase